MLVTLYVHQLYPMQPVTAFSHTDVMRPVLLFLRSVAYFPTHHTCPFFTRVSAVRFGLPLITIIADREYWLTPTRSPRFLPPSPFLASSLVIATSESYRSPPITLSSSTSCLKGLAAHHSGRLMFEPPGLAPTCRPSFSLCLPLSCLVSRSQLPFRLD